MLDVIVCLLLLNFGLSFKSRIPEFDDYDRNLLTKLYFYHLAFGVIYYFYIGSNGGDAEMYWGFPKKYILNDIWVFTNAGYATKIVATFNYLPAHILDLSFFTGFIIYTTLGYIGWVYFYRIIKENVPRYQEIGQYKIFGFRIFPWVLFLPNLHFWTVAIGKDSLLFMCIAFFIYGLGNIQKRIVPIGIAVFFSILVRPHILFFMVAAYAGSTMISKEIKTHKKVILFVVFAIIFFSMIGYVMEFLNLDSLDADSIEQFTANKAAKLSSDRFQSAVDTSNYPIILKVLTFLYRPLFFDSSSILDLAASLENLFWVFFSIKIFTSKPFSAFKKSNLILKTMVLFFIIGSVAFSMTLGNLGIMLRQKTPFMLMLMIFGFYALTQRKDFKPFTRT